MPMCDIQDSLSSHPPSSNAHCHHQHHHHHHQERYYQSRPSVFNPYSLSLSAYHPSPRFLLTFNFLFATDCRATRPSLREAQAAQHRQRCHENNHDFPHALCHVSKCLTFEAVVFLLLAKRIKIKIKRQLFKCRSFFLLFRSQGHQAKIPPRVVGCMVSAALSRYLC